MTISQIVHRRHRAESLPLLAPSETYHFIAPRRARALLTAATLAAAVLTVIYLVSALRSSSTAYVVAAAACAIAMVGLWTTLQARVPQTVSLRNSVIEIARPGSVERFDLADPTVEVLARDGEMAFRCYDGRFAIVRSRDVRWQEFTHVVMHYQNHADRKAEERQNRFNL